jgi:hypothetical protein
MRVENGFGGTGCVVRAGAAGDDGHAVRLERAEAGGESTSSQRDPFINPINKPAGLDSQSEDNGDVARLRRRIGPAGFGGHAFA